MALSQTARAQLDSLGSEFLVAVYGRELERHPDNVGVLLELGNLYTRLGRYEEGLAIDRELVSREPQDDTVRYNLACSLALLGRHAEALDELETAVALGYEDRAQLEADEDLASLRTLPRFAALVAHLKSNEAGRDA